MGKGSKAPEYPTTTVNTGLFGKTVTNKNGSKFKATGFQKNLVNTAQSGALNALSEYLNPNYDSEEFRQADDYYTNKMNNQLQNNYLAPALTKNLLRGSTASDVMRGFASDLANTEYERQQDYRDQQLNKLQAALLGYNNIYDIAKGVTGLSNSLANSIGSYNMNRAQLNNQSSGIGDALGSLGSMAGQLGSAAILASDRRLKENIEKLDEVDGINIYKFDYINGGDKNQVGVIAQEIEDKYPECVVKDWEFLKVDYSKLPEKVQQRIKELGGQE